MKTLTEFSGTLVRMAVPAADKVRASFPAPAAAEGETAAPAPSEEQLAALDAAIAEATGLSGDRVTRLREALEAVGGRAADVRLVRVYAAEPSVAGARKVGEHQFVVDLMPQSMKPTYGRPEKEREGGRGKGRGGRDGGRDKGAARG